MGCPTEGILGRSLLFSVNYSVTNTGPVDPDATPTFVVYEMEDVTPIVTGTLTKRGTTVGSYAETLGISASAGFEANKGYQIEISAAIGGVSVRISYNFNCLSAGVADEHAGAVVAPAEILAYVNEELELEETDIDVRLRRALKRITALGNFLDQATIYDLAETVQSLALPDDFKALVAVTVDGYACLEVSSAAIDEERLVTTPRRPERWAIRAGRIEFDATADAEYSVVVHSYRYHPDDVGTILLGGEFYDAICELTTAFVAKKYGRADAYQMHMAAYEAALMPLLPRELTEPHQVRYNDL